MRRYARETHDRWGLLPIMCWLGIVAQVAWAPGALAESEALSPDDFAVGRILEASEPRILHSVLLDYDVYRRSVEPGLADIRVFDDDGRPAPYAIRRRVPAAKAESEFQDVPIFALGGVTSESTQANSANNAYRFEAELSDLGAIVSVHRGDGTDSSKELNAGWLVDISQTKRPIVGLRFQISSDEGDFLSTMRLESSNDLARFSVVDANIALARLVQDGHRIERASFEIPPTRARYLRIMPIDAAPAAELLGVQAKFAPASEKPARMQHTIEGRFDRDQPGVVVYDLGASLPVERVQIRLVEMNTIVEGRLEAAATADGPWRIVKNGIFYFFEKGGSLRNGPVRPRSSSDRHLRLVTSTRGGGLVGGPPQLQIDWRPEQLLYVLRGSGHSLLAVGRAGTKQGSFSAADLLRMGQGSNSDLRLSTASLGPEAELAGESVLERIVPTPWRTYGLWALLLVCVGSALGLSLRLMKGAGH